MNFFGSLCTPRRLVLIVVAARALTVCSMTMAIEAVAPENLAPAEKSDRGLVGLSVSGGSAG